jgi:hypothetical protein
VRPRARQADFASGVCDAAVVGDAVVRLSNASPLHLTSVKGMRKVQYDGMLGTPYADTSTKGGDAFPVCIAMGWRAMHPPYGQMVPHQVRLHPF